MADAFEAAMDAMAERFPERRAFRPPAMLPTAPASRPRPSSTCPPPPSTRPAPSTREEPPLLRPSRLAWATLPTPTWPTTPPSASSSMCPHTHATVTARVSGVDAAAAIAAIDVVARPQATLDLRIALTPRCRPRRRGFRAACAPTSTPPST